MRLGELLRIAIPLADALAAAHTAGIVHRDLKPANVMVTLEGVVKVLDFGLAKLALRSDSGRLDIDEAPTVDARDLSRAGTVAGTLGYMSPEQASGGSVDSRSDVFSFGAVLYEMVTGRRAFGGRSGAEMLAAVLKDQPKPPSETGDRRAAGTRASDPALSPQRRRPSFPEHARCEGRAAGGEGGIRLASGGDRGRDSPPGPAVADAGGGGCRARDLRGAHGVAGPQGRPAVAAGRGPHDIAARRRGSLFPGRKPGGIRVTDAGRGLGRLAEDGGRDGGSRLTTNPADDFSPAWSPDGRQSPSFDPPRTLRRASGSSRPSPAPSASWPAFPCATSSRGPATGDGSRRPGCARPGKTDPSRGAFTWSPRRVAPPRSHPPHATRL